MHDDFFLPADYLFLDEEEAHARIQAHRARLGGELAIWAHWYQRASVRGIADLVGDGVALAKAAARGSSVRFLLACTVRYVAENARLLLPPATRVAIPDLEAGCPMATTLPLRDLDATLAALRETRPRARVTPLASVAADVEVKARCGELGGATLGASNAARVLRWALARSDVAVLHGDRPLALAAARELGLAPEELVVWRAERPSPAAEIARARLLVNESRCPVHAQVRPEDVAAVRREHPGTHVLVQRELAPEVVAEADFAGSIAELASAAARLPPGGRIAIGSETHAVEAIASALPGHAVVPLAPTFCATMYMVHPANVLYALDRLGERGEITIDPALAEPARIALLRMLEGSD